MTRSTFLDAYKPNFDTLKHAFDAEHVGLVECRDRATGYLVAILCAFSEDANGDITMTPFARMFDGNPYEQLDPPNPDGGFFEEEGK